MKISELVPGCLIEDRYGRVLEFIEKGFGDCYEFLTVNMSYRSADFLSKHDIETKYKLKEA